MAFDILGSATVGAGLVGILAFLVWNRTIKVKKRDMVSGVLGVLAVAMIIGGFSFNQALSGDFGTFSVGGASTVDESGAEITYRQVGSSSAVGINSFTGTWGGVSTKTEVYPSYAVLNSNGVFLVDNAGANSTTTAVGEKLDLYVMGSAYYGSPVLGFDVMSDVTTIPDVEVYTIMDAADGDIVVYDNTGSSALTADDNANNTADYSLALGAGQEEIIFAKYTNKDADKVMDVGLLCTYYTQAQEIDDFTLIGTDSVASGVTSATWSEVSIPKGLKDSSAVAKDDGNVSTSIVFAHCYEPSETVRLTEWKWIKLQFNIDTDDSTAPTANGDSNVGFVVMDATFYKDVNGKMQYGAFNKGDGTEDAGAVGLDENPETTITGLDNAVQIEIQ